MSTLLLFARAHETGANGFDGKPVSGLVTTEGYIWSGFIFLSQWDSIHLIHQTNNYD
jgi:hypothetical protein